MERRNFRASSWQFCPRLARRCATTASLSGLPRAAKIFAHRSRFPFIMVVSVRGRGTLVNTFKTMETLKKEGLCK